MTLRTKNRRGVLLLIVLSMLTLFLMLGTAYMVAATRARASARAFARLTFGDDEMRIPAARMLDTVLLRVVAGGTTAPTGGPAGLRFESLLADKYGLENPATTGSATTVTVNDAFIEATLDLNSTPRPSDLNGRVLSFIEPGRVVSSHRIIRAQGPTDTNAATATPTVVLDRPYRREGLASPTAPSRVIINGREFAGNVGTDLNESWDGFDVANPFLARVAPGATISTSTVSRISFFPTLTGTALTDALSELSSDLPDGIDNDNDGSLDGIFLSWGLPDQTDAYGNVVQLRASVLVVDLDGRFNVNAHGSLAPLMYGPSHPGWTTAEGIGTLLENAPGEITPLETAPMGAGYGSADVHANGGFGTEPKTDPMIAGTSPRLFDNDELAPEGAAANAQENPKHAVLTGAGLFPDSGPGTHFVRQRGVRPAQSRYSVGQPTYRLRPMLGRYADRTPTGANGWLTGTQTLDGPSFTYGRPGSPNQDDATSRLNDRRALPSAAPNIGYGVPPTWWNGIGANTYDWAQASATAPFPRGIYNSPPDLHGRMKTLTIAAPGTAIAPQLVFAKPEWTTLDSNAETKDDPYEAILDTRRGFAGWLHDPGTNGTVPAIGLLHHNPFLPAELDPVLRPYDIDNNRGLPRLAAILGSTAESSRLKITTDSWDTTAITGGDPTNGAAARLRDWLAAIPAGVTPFYGTSPIDGILNAEIGRGERFDLNRALAAAAAANAGYQPGTQEYHRQRIAYFKDLYTLLVALEQGGGAPLAPAKAAELAQWAANVVEFRDADSRIIPFEYDIDPRNGWNVDGDVTTDDGGHADRRVVWGCERPEILIQETLAWENADSDTIKGGLFIALHRPWNARAYGSGTNNFVDAEPCDLAFDTLSSGTGGRPTNRVDLGKKPHQFAASSTNALYGSGAAAHLPIWRLRLVTPSGTSYVRLDTGGTSTPSLFVSGTITTATTNANGNQKPKLGMDETLTLYGDTSVTVDTGTQTVTVTGSSHPIAFSASTPFRMPGTPNGPTRSGTCYLERLSDPMPNYTLSLTDTVPGTAVTGQQIWDADPLIGGTTTTIPIRYIPIDEAAVTIHNTGTSNDGDGTDPQSQQRSVNLAATGLWKPEWTPATPLESGTFPSLVPTSAAKWFPWLNRPFVSAAELMLVPKGDSLSLVNDYEALTPATVATRGCPVELRRLLDAVHVPSRFAAIHTTGTGNYESPAGIFSSGSNAITTINQFSAFREPGRVNINTVTALDVWNAVVAGPLHAAVVTGSAAGLGIVTGTATPQVARSAHGMLTLSASGSLISSDTNAATTVLAHDRNPLHEIYTATRLANTATTRSNVFAIWITLRAAVDDDPDSVRYHRAFYIVDRSIPVAFEPERVHNVWDAVRLRRIIE
jgi:hypothetical protein